MKRFLLAALWTAWMLLPGSAAFGGEFVFAGYNVANFSPLVELGRTKPGKTAKATDAVMGVIKTINPDILGVCEMGTPAQFAHFRQRLSDAGLGYTDFEYVEAADPERRLALVSRLPIVARNSRADISFDANGSHEKIRRGILDVTVRAANGYLLRIVGVHLKSRLPSREGEELLRRHEAHLLRLHVDAILAAAPETNLLVYGDFNDTKDQAVIREIGGRRGAPGALTPLPLEDSHGDRWTHYWRVNDVYSRIDYLFVNRAVSRAVVRARCYLYRAPGWNEASDHRPLVATFRTLDPPDNR